MQTGAIHRRAAGRRTHLGVYGAVLTLVLVLAADSGAGAQSIEYRTTDGTGNNIAHPDWGAAGAHLLRGPTGAHYSNGISSMSGASRPSPREISNALFIDEMPLL